MSKKAKPSTSQSEGMKQARSKERLERLRDGVKNRSATHASKRDKARRRKGKYPTNYEGE